MIVKIPLSRTQVAQLTPYIDRVRSAFAQGSPGMLVAQVRWNEAEGLYWIEPCFLEHEDARKITEKGKLI